MPLSDSLAARITTGLFAAIWFGDVERGVAQLGLGNDPEHRAVVVQLRGGRGRARVDHRPHLVLGDQAREVGGRAERAPVDLGEPERGVVGRDDHVGVADEADPAAEAEAVHGGDDRNRALVHRGERGVAAPVRADQGLEALGGLHLLDVDAGVEPPPFGSQHHDPDRGILAEAPDRSRRARTTRRP